MNIYSMILSIGNQKKYCTFANAFCAKQNIPINHTRKTHNGRSKSH